MPPPGRIDKRLVLAYIFRTIPERRQTPSMSFIKKLFFLAICGGIIYALFSYHFIYFGGTQISLLKKSQLTLNYTFYSVSGKTNKFILAKEPLREDGIGDLLVKMGRMTEDEKQELLKKYRR
jgi:hypothetical protein